jgi:putative membrane protein
MEKNQVLVSKKEFLSQECYNTSMVKLIVHWFIHALSLYIVAKLLPGITITNFSAALVAVLVIGLVNVLVKPILVLLTLPFTILSLGLFLFVINAVLLMIAGSITPGFRIEGFGTAIVASILLSILTTIFQSLIH